MAKKDAASKRLAKEIALAKLLKEKPFFPPEELPARPAPEELIALLEPWPASPGSHASLGSYGRDAPEKPMSPILGAEFEIP
jgi:hypothetical protein